MIRPVISDILNEYKNSPLVVAVIMFILFSDIHIDLYWQISSCPVCLKMKGEPGVDMLL